MLGAVQTNLESAPSFLFAFFTKCDYRETASRRDSV
jgi:hypothetical protein